MQTMQLCVCFFQLSVIVTLSDFQFNPRGQRVFCKSILNVFGEMTTNTIQCFWKCCRVQSRKLEEKQNIISKYICIQRYTYFTKEAFDLQGRRQQEQQLGPQHRHQHQLTHEKPEDRCQENNSNLTDCSTVHGIPSSHCANTHTHTHARLRADTHCVKYRQQQFSSKKKFNLTHPPPPPINKQSPNRFNSESLAQIECLRARVCS